MKQLLPSFLCRWFGHKTSPIITGFRHPDASAIGRCPRCNTPIVDETIKASASVMTAWLNDETPILAELAKLVDCGWGIEIYRPLKGRGFYVHIPNARPTRPDLHQDLPTAIRSTLAKHHAWVEAGKDIEVT